MKDLTAIIVTFNRPEVLKKLIKSIRKYYKELPIIVVDNGEKTNKIRLKGVEYYKVPFDSGLSYSRNFALSKVKTDYIVLLDDDFEFTEETKIEELLKISKENDIDIVGGAVEGLEYDGILEIECNTVLRYVKGNRGQVNGFYLYDMVLNFFVGKVSAIKNMGGWDEELKLAEHTDFFLRGKGKLRVTFYPKVSIKHNHEKEKEYLKFRMRAREYVQLFMFKNGLRKIINFAGNENIINPLYFKDNKYKDITFCIKTFERKPALERLLFSIARYYPLAQIIIADDSKIFDVPYYKDLWARLEVGGLFTRPVAYNLGYDMGLSYGRNFLVDKATTKYCLILDDDYEFTEKTDILKLQTILEKDERIGLAGGLILTEGINELHFEHNFELVDKILYHRAYNGTTEEIDGIEYITPDCIPNFFLMRKELGVKWDNKIKISGEHSDFFFHLKGKWKTAYCKNVSINHIHHRDEEYKVFRKREEFLIGMMIKNGFDKIVYLNGGGYEVKNRELIKF